jgi:hypothetical protein
MNADSSPAPVVTDNPSASRYEMTVGGDLAGYAEYRLGQGGTVLSLVHTVVTDAFQGKGLATHLARFALDDARGRGLAVLPSCPYMASWIKKHPAYADLVPADRRAGFGLPGE